MTTPIAPHQADREATQAEAFGQAYRAQQMADYGCAGDIECTLPMAGNCHCFNVTLAHHAQQARLEERERFGNAIMRARNPMGFGKNDE